MQNSIVNLSNPWIRDPTSTANESSLIVSRCESKFAQKLFQNEIAWDFHCLLRFLKLSYETENTKFIFALGSSLPCLVDGNYVLCDKESVFNLHNIFQYSSLEIFEENKMCSFLEQHLLGAIQKLKSISKREIVIPSAAFGIGWVRKFYNQAKQHFSNKSSAWNFLNQQELIESIGVIYERLNNILQLSQFISSTIRPTRCDAILFSCILESLCLPEVKDIVLQKSYLISYFKNIYNIYFLSADAVSSWEGSNYAIASNPCYKDYRKALVACELPTFSAQLAIVKAPACATSPASLSHETSSTILSGVRFAFFWQTHAPQSVQTTDKNRDDNKRLIEPTHVITAAGSIFVTINVVLFGVSVFKLFHTPHAF